jgi:repressor LexA
MKGVRVYFTEKQLRIMKFIQEFRSRRGISPTMEEIAEKIGVTKITVYGHLNQLEQKGALKRERFRARSIEPLVSVGDGPSPFALPFAGTVQPGCVLPDRPVEDAIDLRTIVPCAAGCFLVRMGGDSLAADGIQDGDYLVLEKRSTPRNGDLALAALADGRVALGRCLRDRSRTRLRLLDAERTEVGVRGRDIRGVVVGLVRNFIRPQEN